MEIIVQGIARKLYMPNEVRIQLEFYRKEDTYEEALEKGTRDVDEFIKKVLGGMNIRKEEMRTKSFRIFEETRPEYDKKQEVDLGFVFQQRAFLKFDYSASTMAEWIVRLTNLENPPKCNLTFGLKDEEKAKEEVIADAFKNAKKRAEAIAKASQKHLKQCLRTDFKPFESNLLYGNTIDIAEFSNSQISTLMYMQDSASELEETIQTIFIPEEIEIEEVVYCLWQAE